MKVRIEKFFHFVEDFLYFDPQDIGYQTLLCFYLCTPLTIKMVADEGVVNFYAENPRWAPIKALDPGEFQPWIREALYLYLNCSIRSDQGLRPTNQTLGDVC